MPEPRGKTVGVGQSALKAKLCRNKTNIPIPIALVPIDQRALNHVKRIDNKRGVRKKPLGVALGGEAQCHLLGIDCFHIEQRADLGAGKSLLLQRLLWKVPAVRE